MRTGFEPGLEEQKAKTFRKHIARLEGFSRGELLPAALPRPEDPLGALRNDMLKG
jgi:hypothetical protein